ncbi:MAG: hypothetical protein WCJ50_06705 [Actinomycetes bacterium]
MRTSDPGITSVVSATALQAGPGGDAATRSSAAAVGSVPAASETKAPAVSASYIAASASVKTASVYIQGDSLTVPISALLAKLMPRDQLTISAKIGRPLRVGLAQLTARSKLHGLDQIIVMEMGSNDDPALPSIFGRMIDQTMAVVGPDRCAVWVNLYQRATKKVGKTRVAYNVYDALNTVISVAARKYKKLSVVNWAAAAAKQPTWFGSDGVHPNDAGSAAFAQMIAGAVDKCKKGPLPAIGPTLDPSGGLAPPS